jgi:hypothetical protein
MGGPGSGRAQIGKATTTSALELDVRVLQQGGLMSRTDHTTSLSWSVRGINVARLHVSVVPGGVQLMYCREQRGYGWVQIQQYVKVDSTPCTFGGQRYWFRCPSAGCARRAAKLYLDEGERFACRNCCRLVYESQREPKDIRAIRRAERLRERLGWRPGILNGHGSIPAGMHGQTYWQLVGLHDKYLRRALEGHAQWAERFHHNYVDECIDP